jgi:hypothetical protein
MSQTSDRFDDKEVKKGTRGPVKPLSRPEIQEILTYLRTARNLKVQAAPQHLKGKENRNKRKTWQNSIKQYDKPEANETELYIRDKQGRRRRVVPIEEVEELVLNAHNVYCHPGINSTYAMLIDIFFWHNMKKSISDILKKCTICSNFKYPAWMKRKKTKAT